MRGRFPQAQISPTQFEKDWLHAVLKLLLQCHPGPTQLGTTGMAYGVIPGPYVDFVVGMSFFSSVLHTPMCTHKHTPHTPTGSTAFSLIICPSCHSNPCSQVLSWTSFTRQQNVFLHCSHWKSRAWTGLNWLKEWPAVKMMGKGSEKTPDQLQASPRWKKLPWFIKKGSDYTWNTGFQDSRPALCKASAAGTQVPSCKHTLLFLR